MMRAAYITEPGPPEAIRVGELPVPAAGPADVLVEVDVVAVNQVDTYIRAGRYPIPMPHPFIVGRDLVGTVAAASRESGFAPGQPVWCNSLGHSGRQGSFSEYAVVPVERLYPLPETAERVSAVAVFHPAAGRTRVCDADRRGDPARRDRQSTHPGGIGAGTRPGRRGREHAAAGSYAARLGPYPR